MEKEKIEELAEKIKELMEVEKVYHIDNELKDLESELNEKEGYISDRDFFDAILYLLGEGRIKEVVLFSRSYQRLEPHRYDRNTIIGYGIVKAVAKSQTQSE